MLQETYTQINAVLLATSPLNHSAAGSGLKSHGHWLGLQALARDRCVSDNELPVREILFIAACIRALHLCCLWLSLWGNLSRSYVYNRVLGPSHPWIMDTLLLLGQLYGLFCNLTLCVSIFLGGNPVFPILTS